jgi:hypothetical protein
MQQINQLIQLIRAKGKNNLALFEKYSLRQGKEQSLYKGITNGAFQTDHQAAKFLYVTTPEDSKYLVLKMRLEEKLLNYLLYIECNEAEYKSGKKPLHKCEVQLYQARMLIRNGKLNMGERLLKKALRVAKEYEFNAIACQILELLLEVYTQTGSTTSYRQVKEVYVSLLETLSIEQQAAALFRDAKFMLVSAEVGAQTLAAVSKVVSSLEALWKRTLSYTCFDYYYRLHVEELQLEGKYPQLVVLTMLSDEFIRDLKINSKRFDAGHNHTLHVYALFRTNDIVGGLTLARKGQSLFAYGSEGYLAYQESCFLLAMHAGDYRLALKIVNEVEPQIILNKTLTALSDKWKLYRIYLALMKEEENGRESIQELMKQTLPAVQKDKQGYNIAFVILQFCCYLSYHQKDVLSTKADTYKKYMERHMLGDHLIRERIFFLLMLLVIRYNFNHEQITKKASRLILQLKQTILPGGALVSAVEIVPYERLWGHILQISAQMKEYKKVKLN